MKKVFLIGDSIRSTYDTYVKQALVDKCEVYIPNENCRFAQYVYCHLPYWKEWQDIPSDIDVVHWNAGAWDTLESYGQGCLTPPEIYAYYIDKTFERIKLIFPKSKNYFCNYNSLVRR